MAFGQAASVFWSFQCVQWCFCWPQVSLLLKGFLQGCASCSSVFSVSCVPWSWSHPLGAHLSPGSPCSPSELPPRAASSLEWEHSPPAAALAVPCQEPSICKLANFCAKLHFISLMLYWKYFTSSPESNDLFFWLKLFNLELAAFWSRKPIYCNEALSEQQTAVSLPGTPCCFLLLIRQLLKGHCQQKSNWFWIWLKVCREQKILQSYF